MQVCTKKPVRLAQLDVVSVRSDVALVMFIGFALSGLALTLHEQSYLCI
jgi:hypothetical protein